MSTSGLAGAATPPGPHLVGRVSSRPHLLRPQSSRPHFACSASKPVRRCSPTGEPGFGVLAGPRPAHGLAPTLPGGRALAAGAGRVSSSRLGPSVPLPMGTPPAAAVLGVLGAGQLFLSGSSAERGGASGGAARAQLSATSFAPSHTCSRGTWSPQVSGFGAWDIHWVGRHIMPSLICHFTGKFTVGFLKLNVKICYYRT